MSKLHILLICGSGSSTGFMAAKMRKEASKQGLDWEITARSEGEVENYVDNAHCIMVGPHLAYLIDELKERYGDRDIKIALMDKSYYSTLDGIAAIKHIESLY